jgi:hypothetical protein
VQQHDAYQGRLHQIKAQVSTALQQQMVAQGRVVTTVDVLCTAGCMQLVVEFRLLPPASHNPASQHAFKAAEQYLQSPQQLLLSCLPADVREGEGTIDIFTLACGAAADSPGPASYAASCVLRPAAPAPAGVPAAFAAGAVPAHHRFWRVRIEQPGHTSGALPTSTLECTCENLCTAYSTLQPNDGNLILAAPATCLCQ